MTTCSHQAPRHWAAWRTSFWTCDLTQFDELGLADPLLKALNENGLNEPTAIQAQAIPALIASKDVLGIAQTGTGKTAAFALPILNALAGHKMKCDAKSCATLVLAPTRELAAQIFDAFKLYGRHLRPSLALVVGGAKHGPQIKAMSRGVDILVATPGRLLDHVAAGKIRLDRTTRIVLDEADQMLDMGFLPAIKRVLGAMPPNRQTMLLSATMPKQIKKLADEILNDPVAITIGGTARPIERIAQKVILLPRAEKNSALINLLSTENPDRVVVFTRTKHGADKVCRQLDKAGLAAAAIHGNKSQGQRVKVLAQFKSGKVPILVATDIAARGIDVDGVSHVINYDLPMTAEAYVHRIGRTARAGRSGIAISLCDIEEVGLLHEIEKLIDRRIDAEGKTEWAEQSSPASRNKPARRGKPRRPGGPRNNSKAASRNRSGGPARADGNKGPKGQKGKKVAGGDAPPRRKRRPAKQVAAAAS